MRGPKVVKTPGAPNTYICAKGDGSPLSTIIENNPQMAVKDPKTGKPKVHMIGTTEHHVVGQQNYDDCIKVLNDHLKESGPWAKGAKLTHTIHGEPPSDNWHATAHIEWERPMFCDPKKMKQHEPRNRSGTAVLNATANPNGSSAAFVVEPVGENDSA